MSKSWRCGSAGYTELRERRVHVASTSSESKDAHDCNASDNTTELRSTESTHENPSRTASEDIVHANDERIINKSEMFSGSVMKQQTLSSIVNSRAKTARQQTSAEHSPLNFDLDEPQRKRRRTNDSNQENEHLGLGGIQNESHKEDVVMEDHPSIVSTPTARTEDDAICVIHSESGPDTPPKKMLRLNANGRFSSPVLETSTHDQGNRNTTRKRGRPRKPKPVLLVKIRYGFDATNRGSISTTINRILDNEERFTPNTPCVLPKPKTTPLKPKATHPFFLGKAKGESTAPTKTTPRKASAVTPGKLRLQTSMHHQQEQDLPANDGFGSSLFKDRLMVKHPGARDPPFPTKDSVHVRGLDAISGKQLAGNRLLDAAYGHRKYKETRLPFPEQESVVLHKALHTAPCLETHLRPDGFRDPHPSLHVPKKRIICGEDILIHVVSQLRTQPTLSFTGSGKSSSSQPGPQSAVQVLLNKIPTSVSLLDELAGMLAWTQKYAPVTASEVLQPEKEMMILKEWLKSLAVQTVSTGIPKDPKSTSKLSTKPFKKRKKKKNSELDDFLVDSDDEFHDVDEVLEPDVDSLTGPAKSLKSIVHVSQGGTRLSNAVLLSGPAGCGKTAAAYAVAKELGFKVFELNPGERRSGKDVIERVGDMAENHLVKNHGTDSEEHVSTEELNVVDEAFRRDLESGRQGKMNAFFKPQGIAKPPAEKVKQQSRVMQVVRDVIRKPPKEQQQSLILLEEVDILFKDDKEFWTVIFKMVIDSKRPFIMTCNDEDLVPIQAMKLHAVLRLSQPSEDLATDYMLLIAAAEGHLLERHAILTLYRSKSYDFRAALTQLDFWCQIGIGDPRGGLSWIYQRWPPGSDLDKKGRKLRVVSDGTYQETTGLVPDTGEHELDDELQFVWTEYDVDPALALGWDNSNLDMVQPLIGSPADPGQQFAMIKNYADLADNLSAVDVCSTFSMPTKAPLNTTTPEIAEKARNQYAEGMRLLQTDEYIEYSHLSQDLFIGMTSSAFKVSGRSTTPSFLPYITSSLPNKINRPQINRRTFACFDPIAAPEDTLSSTSPGTIIQSTFDGPLGPIALDLAPYVRSIVRYDYALEAQRDRIDRLLLADGGGRRAKRARTTRAARSALEGGQRATTRKERWFTKYLDYDAVLATGGGGGEGWNGIAVVDPEQQLEEEEEGTTATEGRSPGVTSVVGTEETDVVGI